MEDTTRENRKLVYDVVMSKPVEERFLMCARLYEDAKALARIGMPPGLSNTEEKAFVFRRIHGADPIDFIEGEWLDIVYSGFWDYPFAFVVQFEGSVYMFLRGNFDEQLGDYPAGYDVFRNRLIDMRAIHKNFQPTTGGEFVGRIDMREIRFDPSHRQRINSKVFVDLGVI